MGLKNSPVHKIKTKNGIMNVSLISGFKGRKMSSGSKTNIFLIALKQNEGI